MFPRKFRGARRTGLGSSPPLDVAFAKAGIGPAFTRTGENPPRRGPVTIRAVLGDDGPCDSATRSVGNFLGEIPKPETAAERGI